MAALPMASKHGCAAARFSEELTALPTGDRRNRRVAGGKD